ncbi:THAP domain-containing protein 1-like [Aphis craccivora]|uniref:THAP domain-containing protein 1-like n=1 Tax=Aphis craccivora TaxID=307492 RepID=A0A6G0YWJ0_APHCR|nr:THAP domain-containing protein 1-like [Aphis craccivora]
MNYGQRLEREVNLPYRVSEKRNSWFYPAALKAKTPKLGGQNIKFYNITYNTLSIHKGDIDEAQISYLKNYNPLFKPTKTTILCELYFDHVDVYYGVVGYEISIIDIYAISSVIAHYQIRVQICNNKDAWFHPEGYDSMQTKYAPQYIRKLEDQQQQMYQSYQHQSTFMTLSHLFY